MTFWSFIGWSLAIGFFLIFYKSFKKAAAEVDARRHASAVARDIDTLNRSERTAPGNGRRLKFNYVDVNHEWSKRTVKLQNVSERHGLIYLQAFCELRKEERTFRADRIQLDIVDVETGEILSPHDLLNNTSLKKLPELIPDKIESKVVFSNRD